jgi:AraC-like DNA-binding protein
MDRVLAATDLESAELMLSGGYGGMRISAQGQRRGLRMSQTNLTPAGEPLVAVNAVRLLAATALATFPNDTLTDPTIGDRRDSHPVTVRRAVAFIDEHAGQDISVADIAVGVVARRWGFPSPSWFAAAYRRAYGVPPGHTLRR